MKKIVHIAQSDGGVEEYLYLLLNDLSDEFENILIASEKYKKSIDRFEKLVSKIYIVPMIREINIKSDLKAVIEVKKILKIEKPDIVYLHSSKAGAIGRIALWFNRKVKILYNAHGWYFNADISNKKKKVFALIEKILALRTDKIINISKSEYDSAINYKIAKPDKMCIIENGIDFSKFKGNEKYREETRCKYGIKENEKVIGVVGRLTEQKDPITSIKAFELINKDNKDVKFMFIGDGELKDEVVNYAKEHKLENNIIITGWVNDTEKYIPALDIAILPSRWEGFGLVLLEYMACDKPIIATNVGGIPNIIKDTENGYLIETGAYDQLYKRIKELLNNPDKVKEIVENNKRYREKFDIKKLVDAHKKIINEF